MAYCSTNDIQALNPKRVYNESSTPSLIQVQKYIDQIGAEIDSILQGRGFTTPVTEENTTAKFLEFVTALNARGAAALAEQAMFPESRGLMQGTSQASVLWKQYQDGLKWLREGKLPSGTPGDPLPFSFFTREGDGETEPGETDFPWQKPKFGKNKDF